MAYCRIGVARSVSAKLGEASPRLGIVAISSAVFFVLLAALASRQLRERRGKMQLRFLETNLPNRNSGAERPGTSTSPTGEPTLLIKCWSAMSAREINFARGWDRPILPSS